MVIFDDARFITMVENSWSIKEAAHISVSQKELEALIVLVR
jgi:hypothetical protein